MVLTSGVGAGDAGDAAASSSNFIKQIWAKFYPDFIQIWINLDKFYPNFIQIWIKFG